MRACFTSAEFKTRSSTKRRSSGLFYPEAQALTSNTLAYKHSGITLSFSLTQAVKIFRVLMFLFRLQWKGEHHVSPLVTETLIINSCSALLKDWNPARQRNINFSSSFAWDCLFPTPPCVILSSHFLHFSPISAFLSIREGSAGARRALQLSS